MIHRLPNDRPVTRAGRAARPLNRRGPETDALESATRAVGAPHRSRAVRTWRAVLAIALIGTLLVPLVTACAPEPDADAPTAGEPVERPDAEPIETPGGIETPGDASALDADGAEGDAGTDGRASPTADAPQSEMTGETGSDAGALAPPPVPPWETDVFADHPLVGRIWSVSDTAFVEPTVVVEGIASAPFVMLGEKHDNPDHHRVQAWLAQSMIDLGRRPAVAFEQLTVAQETALYDHLAVSPQDAAGIGEAVGWADTGWPEWSMYQPIAAAALESDLPVVPANLSSEESARVGGMGEPLSDEDRERLGLGQPLPDALAADLADEILEAHCGYLTEEMVPPMADVQRARDGSMAVEMLEAAQTLPVDGAILITGNGHARLDRGVPLQLQRRAPEGRVAAVGILEVVDGREDAAAYGEDFGGDLPFDFVWFTPRLDDIDPCVKFQEQLEGMQGGSDDGASSSEDGDTGGSAP